MRQTLNCRSRQREAKGRSARRIDLSPHTADMGFDDRAADRQADAHAGLFGRKESLKEILLDVLLEPASSSGNHNFDYVIVSQSVGLHRPPPWRLCHCLKHLA